MNRSLRTRPVLATIAVGLVVLLLAGCEYLGPWNDLSLRDRIEDDAEPVVSVTFSSGSSSSTLTDGQTGVSPVVWFDIDVVPRPNRFPPLELYRFYSYGSPDAPVSDCYSFETADTVPVRIIDSSGQIVPVVVELMEEFIPDDIGPDETFVSPDLRIAVLEPLLPDTEYTLDVIYAGETISFRTTDSPYVSNVTPKDGGVGGAWYMSLDCPGQVETDTVFEVTFSEDMNSASVISGLSLKYGGITQTPIPSAVSYDAGTRTASVDPDAALDTSSSVVLEVADTIVAADDGRPVVSDSFIWFGGN